METISLNVPLSNSQLFRWVLSQAPQLGLPEHFDFALGISNIQPGTQCQTLVLGSDYLIVARYNAGRLGYTTQTFTFPWTRDLSDALLLQFDRADYNPGSHKKYSVDVMIDDAPYIFKGYFQVAAADLGYWVFGVDDASFTFVLDQEDMSKLREFLVKNKHLG